jgi:hypothetical protein
VVLFRRLAFQRCANGRNLLNSYKINELKKEQIDIFYQFENFFFKMKILEMEEGSKKNICRE